MELIVLIMVLSIYTGAIVAPLALFILARRTGHGIGWQGLIGACAGTIWVALILGFLREFLEVQIGRSLLELAGVAAVLSFAVLAVISLIIVMKSWPARVATQERRFQPGPFNSLAADIE